MSREVRAISGDVSVGAFAHGDERICTRTGGAVGVRAWVESVSGICVSVWSVSRLVGLGVSWRLSLVGSGGSDDSCDLGRLQQVSWVHCEGAEAQDESSY